MFLAEKSTSVGLDFAVMIINLLAFICGFHMPLFHHLKGDYFSLATL
jgi:hypothetical protein